MLKRITNFANSDRYRARIHDLIPGGAHTYSKGDDQFPALSPAAIHHGKGAYVWDLDGNRFLDCSMGLTSVSLGHAYEPVLEAVRRELENGVNFQRPSAIELEVAEAFLALVPCHDMIKFAKNGSTVTTAAVKLARGATGRELAAFPRDHPFFSYDDWFIGRTACDFGVPAAFKQLSVQYDSRDLGSLEQAFLAHPGKIACVIAEPEKTVPQPQTHLRDLIALCHRHGALFIQDEMITGFKTGFPGSIAKYGVEPDMATWGKGIANGFSFCALTGKKEVMELGGIRKPGSNKLFLISTTHGGETHAIAACLATIREFREKGVLEHNRRNGAKVIEGVNAVLRDKGLEKNIAVAPTDWMQTFAFRNTEGAADNGMATLFMQEMIRRGVLFQGAFNSCFSHNDADIALFLEAFAESCAVYEQALESGWRGLLKGEPVKPVFRTLV
jgi:glutamate-1-semialdehyde 2,1-aminomutase